jgi:hypothetical protein
MVPAFVALKNTAMAKAKKKAANKSDDTCWKGYEQIGTKKKSGKTVTNCVPKKASKK